MHPLKSLLEWFPDCDFGVMDHGFLPHGRDYSLLVETSLGHNPGQYQLQFTHVVETSYLTAVGDDLWGKSWGEEFVEYQAWLDAGEPYGYVWGTDWSLAWPGIRAVEPSHRAARWSDRLGREMYEVEIKTDRFSLSLVFHALRFAKVSDDTSTVSRAIIPLA